MTSFKKKGRRSQFFENGKQPQKKIQPKTIESKTKGCGTAPGNLVFRMY
jgi:hypothetical protein